MIWSTSCGVQWRVGLWRVCVRACGLVELRTRDANEVGSVGCSGGGGGGGAVVMGRE